MKMYNMSDEMLAAFKRKLIDTLIIFDKFCTEHKIKYFGCGGTAIGAIRHKGFIPWDDDIDVCMLREDYDRFMSLRTECEVLGYSIIDYHDNGNPTPYGKFIDMNTTLIEFDYQPFISGVFIDIFPLDYVGEDIEVTKEIKNELMSCVGQYQTTTYNMCIQDILKYLVQSHFNTALKAVRCMMGCKEKRKMLVARLEEQEQKLRSIKGEHVLNYYTFYKLEKEIFSKEWFASTIEVPFENTTIKLPIGYHEYLSKLFGDYMSLPPKEQQIAHHSQYYCNLKERLTLKEVKKCLRRSERYVM